MNQGGPCYDYCMCANCWRGWRGLSFPKRLWERLKYIIFDDYKLLRR